LLRLLGFCLLAISLLLSLPMVAFEGAAAAQGVTLTLSASTPSNYTPYNYLLNLTASAPITGEITLYWTINGNGPYINTTHITNGHYERTFGCQSPGNWTLWFYWVGDNQYSAAQSNNVYLQGNPGGSSYGDGTSYTLYIIAAVIVIIALVAIVLFYVRSKSKK
jgi:hypothetical protein